MKYIEQVQGSAQAALPFIIGKDTIYIHTNVHLMEDEKNYEYHEYQFSYPEFNTDFLQLLDEDVRKDAIAQLKEKQII